MGASAVRGRTRHGSSCFPDYHAHNTIFLAWTDDDERRANFRRTNCHHFCSTRPTVQKKVKEHAHEVDKYYFEAQQSDSEKHNNIIMWAMMGNASITLLKFAAYLKTGSNAMLSEAIHSLADSGNQSLLWLGARQAANPPDKRFRYGHGRAAYFWSLISALGIFCFGSGVTIYHGFTTLFDPHPIVCNSVEL